MTWNFELVPYDPADRGSHWAVRVWETDGEGRVVEECTVRFVGNNAEARACEYISWMTHRNAYGTARPLNLFGDPQRSWRNRKPLL
jgi:hypothetical protein